MFAPITGEFSPIQAKSNAAVDIIFVYGLCSQPSNRWDSIINLQWCRERIPAQHTEAHIMAYGYEDLNMQASPRGVVDKAARELLSELDGSKTAEHTSSYSNSSGLEDRSSPDPALPVLFICRGFAGLVVKRALILARSHNSCHPISQRVAGIIFLDTPHNDDVQVRADMIQTPANLRDGNSRNWRRTQKLEHGKDLADITKDFQQLSSLYMIVYFCNEDWLECSGATTLHFDCLWPMVSQDHLLRSTKENHYIVPRSTSAVQSMAYLERAAVGMRRAVSRKSYHKCLESEWATQSLYIGQRLLSTCDWVLAHDKYREWSAADGPAILWISGSPGKGKSVLSSMIVDNLLACQQQTDVIAYCFLEEGLGRDDFAKHILEVLFRQIQEHDAVPEFLLYSLLPEIETIDCPMSREAFQRLLRVLLGKVECQYRIVLVLDGLDKDEWIKCVVIDEINRVNSSRHRPDLMRCLVSSRESCDYNTPRGQSRSINLDHELGVQRDVLQFAESRLAEMYPAIANAKPYLTSVAKGICLQGQGIFLWVAIVFESLQCALPVPEMEKKVQSLPPTIDGIYQRILQSIPTQEKELMKRAFAWLIAANRPLGLHELTEALAIEPDPHRPPGIGTWANRMWICSPLIVTTKDNTVRFRHSSVRKHLLSADRKGIWGITLGEAHTVLARACLILATPEKDRDSPLLLRPREIDGALGINTYASTNWWLHYGLAESHSKTLVGALHHWLTITLHNDCEDLLLPEMARLHQIETTILRIAAYYGFGSLTQLSLEMGVNQSGSCDHCDTPLALAAAGGHLKVVALLIQRGASAAASYSSSGETALHLAAANGSQEIVKLLLKNGARVDSDAGHSDRMPLHAAASSGDVDTMKMLMDYNVDLNIIIPKSGETPLHLAASRGHLQTVKWLVEGIGASDEEMQFYESIVRQRYYQSWTEDLLADPASTRHWSCSTEAKRSAREGMSHLESLGGRYADINMRTREGRTALHLAASNGHVRTVRFLLETGADVNLVDVNAYTALGLAAENGHLKAVKLLLTAGADLGPHQRGATLKSVMNNGHDKVANLLAWHFFSVEIMGKPCQWPVLALATKSKQNTVRNAIRKSHPRDHSMPRRPRASAASPDRKM